MVGANRRCAENVFYGLWEREKLVREKEMSGMWKTRDCMVILSHRVYTAILMEKRARKAVAVRTSVRCILLGLQIIEISC